jgi:hypothetical protein
MGRFKKLGVPSDIMALLAKPPLLEFESKDEYFDLVAGIIEDREPQDRTEFLWLLDYADQQWEMSRLKRMRALTADHWREKARAALVRDREPGSFTNIENRLAELYPGGVDPEIVSARAIILAAEHEQLTYFDKRIDRLQKSSDSIMQLFEGRREVLAHRAVKKMRKNSETLRIEDEREGDQPQEAGGKAASRLMQ